MALFADPEVDVVQCLQGGYGSAQVIPLPRLRRRSPRTRSRSSASRTSPPSTSPSGSERGWRRSTPTASWAWATRRRPSSRRSDCSPFSAAAAPARCPKNPDNPYIRALGGGTVTAPLAGGCLWLLMQTIGTPVGVRPRRGDPLLRGLLPRALPAGRDPDPPRARRQTRRCARSRSRRHGEVRLGRPPARLARTRTLEDVLELHLEPLGVPVLYKLPLGHGKHLAALPLGVDATLDARRENA